MSKIKVMAVVSFEQVRKGDVGDVEYTPRIKALISMGYLRRVEDVGTLPDRQDRNQKGSRAGRKTGNGDRIPGGSEPGEDTGSGGHGTVEVINPVGPETGDA